MITVENKNSDFDSNIEIRTMKSDIEAVKAGGGDMALAANQTAPQISEGPGNKINKTIIFFVIIISIAAGIGFLVYYLALKFLK